MALLILVAFAASVAGPPLLRALDGFRSNGVLGGEVCRQTYRLLDAAEAAADTPREVPAELAAQLPVNLGPAYFDPIDRRLPDAATYANGRSDDPQGWLRALEQTGFEEGLEQWWASTIGPVASTQVLRFGSHEGALSFQRWFIGGSCINSRSAFEVEGLRGGIGLQIVWEGGDTSEQVSFVRGQYRYLVAVRTGGLPIHWWILDLVARAAGSMALGTPVPVDSPCAMAEAGLERGQPQPSVPNEPATLTDYLPDDPGSSTEPDGWTRTRTIRGHPINRSTPDDLRAMWRMELHEAGYVEGWERDWDTPTGAVSVWIQAFRDHQGAEAYERWATTAVFCMWALEGIRTYLPRSVGLTIRWGDASTSDLVTFVRGRFRFTAKVTGTPPPTDRALVQGLASLADPLH